MNSSPTSNGIETTHQYAIEAKPETTSVNTPKTFNIRDHVVEFFDQFVMLLTDSETTIRSTGSEDLDQIIGLKPGEMLVIVARPGMGKTELMLSITEQVCIDKQVPTLIYSGAATASLLVQHIVLSRARFAMNRFCYQYMSPNKPELQRLHRAGMEIAESKLFIEESSEFSMEILHASAIRHKREHDLGLIAIDHNHMIMAYSTEFEVAEISSGIKDLAMELGVPILVLAQLSSRPEFGGCRLLDKPQMFDLQDLCAIDQHADRVGLLHRPDYYALNAEDKEANARQATLIITKDSNGNTGQIPLNFNGELMRFEPDLDWVHDGVQPSDM